MRRLISLAIIALTAVAGFSATLERTSSNTIIFTDDYSTTEYIDATGLSTYVTAYGSGYVRNNGASTFGWDGPSVDIVADSDGNIYACAELSVHSDTFGTPPFGGTSGGYRPDVYLMKFNNSGYEQWPDAVRLRTTEDSQVRFDLNNESKNPNLAVHDDSGAIFATWNRRNSSGQWQVCLQRIDSDGTKPWANEKIVIANNLSYYSAGLTIMDDNVYVAYTTGSDVYVKKYDLDGNELTSARANVTSRSSSYQPKIIAGPDGYLYVAWMHTGGVDIYAQKLNTSLTRQWGSDQRVNNDTGYASGSFWYGWTENGVNIAMNADASSTNLFVVWSAKLDGLINCFMQKIDVSGSGFVRQWTAGGTDKEVSPATGSGSGDVYADIAVHDTVGYVSYITHDTAENDRMMLQRFNTTTGALEWTAREYTGLTHHGRLTIDNNNYAYVTATSFIVKKYNYNNPPVELFNVNYRDRYYVTEFYYSTERILSGTILSARLYQNDTTYQNNAYFEYYVTPNSGTNVYGPLSITNSTGYVDFDITTLGNDFRVYAIGDNNYQEGKNYLALHEFAVEATEIYLGDIGVGKAPDGSDAEGDLILNSTADNQYQNIYVYNNGTNAASGYFFVKNNGNIASNFSLQGTSGTADWSVAYWRCDPSGETNLNITAQVTGSGFVTNIEPFETDEWVIVKAFAVPSVSTGAGDNFSVTLNVSGAINGTDFVHHDTGSIKAIVSFALPDLIIEGKGDALGYGFQNSDASGQSATMIADSNVTKVFTVHLRNAGGSDAINLSADPGNANWTVQYFTNGVNVTAAITGGSGISNFFTSDSYLSNIEVHVTPKTSAGLNSSIELAIDAYSYGDVTKVDKNIAKLIRVATKPNFIIEGIGAGLRNTNSSGQIVTNFADNRKTNEFNVILSNLGSYPMDFQISAVKSNLPSWTVWVFDGGQNITTDILSGYHVVSNLSDGDAHEFTIRVATPATHNVGANEVMGVYLTAKGEGDTNNIDKWDSCGAQHKTISSRVDYIADGAGYLDFETTVFTNQNIFKYIQEATNFKVVLSNSSASPFYVRADLSEVNWGYDVAYTNDGDDISAGIRASNWNVLIPAGGSEIIDVTLHTNSTPIGATYVATLSAQSWINSADRDVVKLTVERAVAPDIQIRKSGEGTFHGLDVYGDDPSAIDQMVGSSYPQGSSDWYQYLIRVQNDRTSAESNQVTAAISTNGWDIEFHKYTGPTKDNPDIDNPAHWANVTANMTNLAVGVYNPTVATNDYYVYRIRIRSDTVTNEGRLVNVDMTATGVDTRFGDTARVSISYGMGLPDIVYYDWSGPDWDDYYATNYTDAVATNYVNKSKGTLYKYIVENDSYTNPSSFLVKGNNDGGSWNITYFKDAIDITSFVINDGYSIFLSNQSSITLSVKLDAWNSTYGLDKLTNISIKVSTEQDELSDYLRIVTVLTDLGRPDLVIGNNGNGTYSATDAPGLGTNILIGWGQTITVPFTLQNDHTNLEWVKLFGSPKTAAWTVKYFTNSVEVSQNVTNNYSTFGLNPYLGGLNIKIPGSSSIDVEAEITLSSNSGYVPGIDSRNFYIYAYSEGRLITDKARIHADVYDFGRPDLIALSDVGDWSNRYESVVGSQIVSTNTEKGWTNRNLFLLENDHSKAEELHLSGTGNSNTWKVAYQYYNEGTTLWENITPSVTNSNFNILLPANSCVTLAVDVFISRAAPQSLESTFQVDMELLSWMSFVTDTGRIQTTLKDMTIPDLSFTNGLWSGTNGTGPGYESIAVGPLSTSNMFVEKGEEISFFMYLENDSDARSNAFYFLATGGSGDWGVKYEQYFPATLAYSNYTYEVTNSNHIVWLSTNEPGSNLKDSRIMRVTVSVAEDASMPTNTAFNVDMTMQSEFGLNRDMGRLSFRYVDKGDPDLVVEGNVGDGLREVPPLMDVQRISIPLERGDSSSVMLFAQNDRTNGSEKLYFTGDILSLDSDFSIKYTMLSNGNSNDVTLEMSNKSFYPILPMQSELTMIVSLSLFSNSTLGTNQFENIEMSLISFGRAYTDVVVLNYDIADLSEPDIYLSNDIGWSNLMESIPDPLSQISHKIVEVGHTNIIDWYIRNGRDKGESMTNLIFFDRHPDWEIQHYFDTGSGWSNITAVITNRWLRDYGGYAQDLMRTVLYIPYDHTNAQTNMVGDSLEMRMKTISWMGYNFDQGKFQFILQDPGKPNIRKENLTWAQVNPDPIDQFEPIDIEKGISNQFVLILTNERADYNKFKLTADSIDWLSSVKLVEGAATNDITEALSNEYYVDFAANEMKTLLVNCFAAYTDTNAQGTVRDMEIELASYKSVTRDRITLSYTLKDLSDPDIVIDGHFDNRYAFKGDVQYTNYLIEKGEQMQIAVEYQNDFERAYTYVIRGSQFDSNWNIIYGITNGGNYTNLTMLITNGGFTNLFGNNETNYGILQVGLISNSLLTTNDVFSNHIRMFSLAKLRVEDVVAGFRITDRGNPRIRFTNNTAVTNLLMKRGDTNMFYLTMSNARSDTTFLSEHMTLKLDPDYIDGWNYDVYLDGSNVISFTTNNGYTITLDNGLATNVSLRISIPVNNSNVSGIANCVRMQAYSQGKGKVYQSEVNVIKQEPTPDLAAIYLSGTGAVGDNEYNNPTNQQITGYIIAASPAIYSIILENDDVIDDNLRIWVDGDFADTNKWEIVIEDDDLGIEQTDSLLSNMEYSIPAGGSKMFILSISAKVEVEMNETNTIRFLTHSRTDTNKYDIVTVHTIRVPVEIYGYVYSQSGEKLGNASVSLNSLFSEESVQTTTDTNGYYELLAVPGSYTLDIACDGYVDSQNTVTVKEVRTFRLDDVAMLPVNVLEGVLNAHSFPNPAGERDSITFVVNHIRDSELRVEVYNMKGVLMKTLMNEQKGADVYTIEWDARDETGAYLEAGVYILLIWDGTEKQTKKIFIQKSTE